MPNCFTFTRKSNPNEGPASLVNIDLEMCEAFGVTVHPVKFYCDWVDLVGLEVACGRTLMQVREKFAALSHSYINLIPVIEWLDANFTTDAFVQR